MIGLKYIKKAIEKEQEKSLWEMWLMMFPNMDRKNFISFEEFKEKATQSNRQKSKEKTDDEMLAMVKILNAAFGGEVVEI